MIYCTSLNSLEDVEVWRNLDNIALTTGWDNTLGGDIICNGERGLGVIRTVLDLILSLTAYRLLYSQGFRTLDLLNTFVQSFSLGFRRAIFPNSNRVKWLLLSSFLCVLVLDETLDEGHHLALELESRYRDQREELIHTCEPACHFGNVKLSTVSSLLLRSPRETSKLRLTWVS